jgi:creatinase
LDKVLERERLVDFTGNGEKVKPTFSAQEMMRRLQAVRKHMADNGIDAALFTLSQHQLLRGLHVLLLRPALRLGRRSGHRHLASAPASTAASRGGGPSARTSPTPTGRRTITSMPSAS